LIKASEIENQLAGTVKLANEERNPDYGVDHDVKLMSNPPPGKGSDAQGNPPAGAAARPKLPTPAALSPEAAEQFEKLQRPLKPGTDKPNSDNNDNTTGSTPAAPN